MSTPSDRYTKTAVAIHWIVAVLIIGNLCWGLYMIGLDLSPTKLRYFSYHKWTGITIFLLSFLRLAWRLTHPAPPLPESMPKLHRALAHASHYLLYVCFFAAPLSGWLYSSAAGFQTVYFGVLPIPDLLSKNLELAANLKVVHRSINCTMAGVILVHIFAAVRHHLVDRDDILVRMIPFLKVPEPKTP
jgi:cytochrome b561